VCRLVVSNLLMLQLQLLSFVELFAQYWWTVMVTMIFFKKYSSSDHGYLEADVGTTGTCIWTVHPDRGIFPVHGPPNLDPNRQKNTVRNTECRWSWLYRKCTHKRNGEPTYHNRTKIRHILERPDAGHACEDGNSRAPCLWLLSSSSRWISQQP
jgi:hypothetical protein